MLPVSVTALYAAILALMIVVLGINVTRHRVKFRVSLGDGGNPELLRMIRAHGNAAEYIPIALVLMFLYETNGGSHLALHAAGIALIVGRVLQSWNMWASEVAGFGRRAGQSLTWLSIVALAALNLWRLVG